MNKKERLTFHKIAILTNLLLSELDDLSPTAGVGVKLHKKSKEFSKALEPFLEAAFESKQVCSGTYLTEISNKVDTVIRKNYEQITN